MPQPPILPLSDDLRPGLRQQPAWMICFNSWLTAVPPSEARTLLHGETETFLRTLDNLTWQVLLHLQGTQETPDDWTEALKQAMPGEETEEREEPLTRAETNRLAELASEAAK